MRLTVCPRAPICNKEPDYRSRQDVLSIQTRRLIVRFLVCSTPLLVLRTRLYTASVVSLTDRRSDWLTCVRLIQLWHANPLLHIQINTVPSPVWRASLMWRKEKAFPLPGTAALWVFWKREFPAFSEAVDSPMLAGMGRETVYKISQSLVAARFVFRIVWSLWNLTGSCAADVSNFKEMR